MASIPVTRSKKAIAALPLAAALVLSPNGCGANGVDKSDAPERRLSAQEQIAEVVDGLNQAIAAGDALAICTSFAPSGFDPPREYGECERERERDLRDGDFAGWRELSINRIRIRGDHAAVELRVEQGNGTTDTAIAQFVREGGRWYFTLTDT